MGTGFPFPPTDSSFNPSAGVQIAAVPQSNKASPTKLRTILQCADLLALRVSVLTRADGTRMISETCFSPPPPLLISINWRWWTLTPISVIEPRLHGINYVTPKVRGGELGCCPCTGGWKQVDLELREIRSVTKHCGRYSQQSRSIPPFRFLSPLPSARVTRRGLARLVRIPSGPP